MQSNCKYLISILGIIGLCYYVNNKTKIVIYLLNSSLKLSKLDFFLSMILLFEQCAGFFATGVLFLGRNIVGIGTGFFLEESIDVGLYSFLITFCNKPLIYHLINLIDGIVYKR